MARGKNVWVVSDNEVHPALVSVETFEHVRRRMRARGTSSSREGGTLVRRSYVLRGLIRCGVCGRKMQGTWNHDRARYRCRFPYEYAVANKIDHPGAVYLREDAVLGPLDAWLAGVLDPARLTAALARAGDDDQVPPRDPALNAARRKVEECERKLARHRAALEAGADPVIVAGWTNELRTRRDAAQAVLDGTRRPAGRRELAPEEIQQVVDSLGGLLSVLTSAAPDDKGDLYRALGVSITYQHAERTALVQVTPRLPVDLMDVSGGGIGHYVHALRASTCVQMGPAS